MCAPTFQKVTQTIFYVQRFNLIKAIELKQLYGLIATTNSLTHSLACPSKRIWILFKNTKLKKETYSHTRIYTEGHNETHAVTSNAQHRLLALDVRTNGIESFGLSCENISSSRRLVSYVSLCGPIFRFTWHELMPFRSLASNSNAFWLAVLLFSSRSYFVRIVSFRLSVFLLLLFGRLKRMLRLNVGMK